jgi:hypothetical protein
MMWPVWAEMERATPLEHCSSRAIQLARVAVTPERADNQFAS